jgi:lipoprotein-anchoring transpeptidase ErfK/SrfK
VHLVTPEEVAPLASNVEPEQKRILVDLRAQCATAFEAEQEVFSAQVSAGLPATFTPLGSFQTNRKRPSRRMVSQTGNPSADYDFPGVPWVSYLTLNGIAFHGAYWHANWGQPMSHGCIEMTPPDAKWLYRWTTPAVPVNERYHEAPSGTHVDVVSGY